MVFIKGIENTALYTSYIRTYTKSFTVPGGPISKTICAGFG